MMRLRLSLIILVYVPSLIATVGTAAEQPVARQYNFRTYTGFDGLPQAQVSGVQQDKQGFIWTGSYAGVTRYNGKDFVTFTDQLPNHSISSMSKTNTGDIIFTTGNGFCLLDELNFSCTTLGETLPLSNLFDTHVSQDGTIWFAAEGGVIRFHPSGSNHYTTKEGLPSPTVRSVLQDRKGRVWAGTRRGLAVLNNDKFEAFSPSIFSKALIRAIIETDDGVWIGGNEGLYVIPNDSSEPLQVGRDELAGNVVLSLFKDSQGLLWIGTYKGLYRLVNGRMEKLSPQKGLMNVAIYAITEDREGNIWLGSDTGLVKYVPGPFVSYTTEQGLSNDFVRAMSIDSQGHIWMGTRHGVSIFNPDNEKFRTLTNQLKSERIRVYAIQALADDSILIGTRAGLIHWQEPGTVKHFSTEDGLESSYVSAFLIDSKKRVWMGTSRGLSRWVDNKIVDVENSQYPIGGIYYLKEDSHGNIWLGTGNQGIVIFNPATSEYSKIEKIPQANEFTVWSIDRDPKGNMWVGTNGNGLLKIDPKLNLIAAYDSKNGLGNDYVWQVKVDSRDHVWAYTNTGLKRYDQEHFIHYDGADGLPDLEGSATAIIEHQNGDLWFGTGYGVTRYMPQQEFTEQPPPAVTLEGVWLGEKKLQNNVSLAHDIDTLLIKFSSLSFKDERDIGFSFRLLGASENWSQPQNIHRLQLASMSPGDYQLQLKAIKGGRIESEELTSFAFSIRPPFWLTWWFIGLTFALSVGIIGLLILRRIHKLDAEKYQLEAVVAERTAELSDINLELNRLVITDHLTKLFNRRHLMDCLQQELSLLSQCSTKSCLSFIILDVDLFKQINDNYGHRMGDKVLKELARRIKRCCRKTDIAARYGGEEFAIILPYTDTKGALICAEKIKDEVASEQFSADEVTIDMTVSLGVVSVDNESIHGDSSDYDRMIKQADIALYQAKHQGRNQVCIFEAGQSG